MIIIGVFSVIINFILSRLFVGYIDELLRSNWQYHLFENENSYIVVTLVICEKKATYVAFFVHKFICKYIHIYVKIR